MYLAYERGIGIFGVLCAIFSLATFGISATTLCVAKLHLYASITSLIQAIFCLALSILVSLEYNELMSTNGKNFRMPPHEKFTSTNFPISFFYVSIYLCFGLFLCLWGIHGLLLIEENMKKEEF
ncbi:hypothetical protein HZS_4665 [Henneguya salminicola]|nr:hypothetical protein HZS_4665 [Henneguya salminicola]